MSGSEGLLGLSIGEMGQKMKSSFRRISNGTYDADTLKALSHKILRYVFWCYSIDLTTFNNRLQELCKNAI
jgi:hypothetical protein